MIKTPLSTVIGGAFWTPGATVIGGNTPTFDQQIQKIFANGEQGFWYDLSDLTTMYQDAVGIVPVTSEGQPVGLMLDKSKSLALGIELIPQPLNFNNWTGTAAVTATTTNSFTTNSAGGCTFPVLGSINKNTYRLRIKGFSTVAWVLRNTITGSGGVSVPQGAFELTATNPLLFNTGSSAYIALGGAGTITFDTISIKEIAGNHAYQTRSAMRPILQDVPRRIDFDAVDDKLIANLPAQLTGCTVIRSAPNVGTQILTGQTIPATHEDNTDHCGLIVINRVLTPSETSAIAAEFNKRAGV